MHEGGRKAAAVVLTRTALAKRTETSRHRVSQSGKGERATGGEGGGKTRIPTSTPYLRRPCTRGTVMRLTIFSLMSVTESQLPARSSVWPSLKSSRRSALT